MANEIVLADGEVIDAPAPTALAVLAEAEVNTQIHTAKKYPRSIDRFMKQAKALVSYSPKVAEQFRYSLPGRGRDGRKIEGVSIHGAKLLASVWGNLRIAGRVIDDDGRFVTAEGVVHDLESNVAYRTEVKVPVRDRNGRILSDDQVKNLCQAAVSKATRNAILSVIPPAFVAIVEEEAIKVARGDAKSLPERIRKAVQYFEGRGISERRIFDALGVYGAGDATLDHLTTLQGFKTALEEGVHPDEIFPHSEDDRKYETRSASLNRSLLEKKNGGKKTEEKVIDVEGATEVVVEEGLTPQTREPGEDG